MAVFYQESRFDATASGHLRLHGIDLIDTCCNWGTPLLVFDGDRIRENFIRFRQAFEKNYQKTMVCFSIKTNSNLAICSLLEQIGAGAEICSELDLYAAIKAGFEPDRVVLDGPFKPEGLLRDAVDKGVALVNVESLSELERLNRIANELKRRQRVGLRVNLTKPGFFKSDPSSRFGFSMEEAFNVLQHVEKYGNLDVNGIMAHPYLGASEIFLPFIKRLHDKLKLQFEFVNFGGGFHSAANIEQIAKSLTDSVKKTLSWEPTIVLEPGSFIVNDAGIALLSVVQVKEVGGRKWVVVDGGVNVLPAPDEKRIPWVANRMTSTSKDVVSIVGPIPAPCDYISTEARVSEVHEGDIIAVSNSGAYTLGYSSQFLYPRPYAIMVTREKGVTKIREKESFEDVLRMDRVK